MPKEQMKFDNLVICHSCSPPLTKFLGNQPAQDFQLAQNFQLPDLNFLWNSQMVYTSFSMASFFQFISVMHLWDPNAPRHLT